ncbi:MAG: DNA ligase D [Parvibaculum sp.]|nr:DNA ligase D [Parvibaculum sp.]
MAGRKQASGLDTYRSMRKFDQTPEPRGRTARRKGHTYAIQMHSARRLHYDLRLELDGVLKSWAVTRGPSLDPSQKRLAVRTEDHPVDYADFEGNIPKGHYGAGTVLLWDRGTWSPIGDPHKGLEKGKLEFRIDGERLKGKWALIRFRGRKKEKRENWLLIKERDDEATDETDPVEEFRTSILTKKKTEELAEDPDRIWSGSGDKTNKKPALAKSKSSGKLPRFSPPALATLVDEVPEGDDWLFEMKFDGYRALAAAKGDDVRIYTRSGLDWTERYGPLADAFVSLDLDGALIDGEIVSVDKQGRSDFSALQQALKGKGGALSFFAFDLLEAEGKDLRRKPLAERKKQLKSLLGDAGRKGPVFFTDHVAGDGAEMLATLCERGFEGVIAKRANTPYPKGRSTSWLKIKCGREQEFIVIGWSPSDKRRPFSSLLLGHHEDGKLVYAGRVGSGFPEDDMRSLAAHFAKLTRKTPPVSNAGDIPPSIARKAAWLRPEIVVQVAFAEFTRDGVLRQARYLGLREDKPAKDVAAEKPARKESKTMTDAPVIQGIPISNTGRVLFPEQGVTKLELAQYLDNAAALMLPHIEKRLISLVRCPQGRQTKCFFQRHAGAGLTEGFKTLPVKGSKEREDYLYLDGRKGLIAAAQMGVLELHLWGSRIDDIERPDRLVFDLDPAPDLPFEAVVEASFQIRDLLRELGLQTFPMLTGGKGVHVIAPLTRRHEWPVVKAFARGVAEFAAQTMPDRYVAVATKAKRKGRIFIDYLRNDRSATAIAPYSPRARKGGPVAWPVSWKELQSAESAAAMTIATAPVKKRKDPWRGYASLRQSLKASALRDMGVDG